MPDQAQKPVKQVDVVNDGSFGVLPRPLYGTSVENARPGRSIEELQADPSIRPLKYMQPLPPDDASDAPEAPTPTAPIAAPDVAAELARHGIKMVEGGKGAYVFPVTSRGWWAALERTAGVTGPPAPETPPSN